MSDDFIPLNQSTPHGKSHHHYGGNQNQNLSGRQQNQRFQGRNRRGRQNNRWGNNTSRNSSFGSDSNSSFSQSQDRTTIDAYLHPSMLEDPWARLRQQQQQQSS